MNKFIREFYDSDLSETNKRFEFSAEGREANNAREKIYNEFKEILSKDDFKRFEEYIDESHIVNDEIIFRAYVSGMRDMVRFVAGAFIE